MSTTIVFLFLVLVIGEGIALLVLALRLRTANEQGQWAKRDAAVMEAKLERIRDWVKAHEEPNEDKHGHLDQHLDRLADEHHRDASDNDPSDGGPSHR